MKPPMNVAYLIPFCFILDITLTYIFMKRYRKIYPQDDKWTENEVNPIAKICWNTFGLEKGSIISALVVSPIILMATYVATLFQFFTGFFIGIYYLIFVIHIQSQFMLNKRIKLRRKKEAEKQASQEKEHPVVEH